MTNPKDTLLEILNLILSKYPELKESFLKTILAQRDEDPWESNSVQRVMSMFHLFSPSSWGDSKSLSIQTAIGINQVFPNIVELLKDLNANLSPLKKIQDFQRTAIEIESANKLKERLDFYGSDKAATHNYHILYGAILCQAENISNIFEIGLGTNNMDIVSTMGPEGKPGASLRAFRDHCKNANIFGGDIDERILFSEERIKTFVLNQTNFKTFEKIIPFLPNDFDLVIDDGLHAPNANIASLKFGLQIVKEGGWVIIEDIRPEALPLWQVISIFFSPLRFNVHLIESNKALIFAVQKIK